MVVTKGRALEFSFLFDRDRPRPVARSSSCRPACPPPPRPAAVSLASTVVSRPTPPNRLLSSKATGKYNPNLAETLTLARSSSQTHASSFFFLSSSSSFFFLSSLGAGARRVLGVSRVNKFPYFFRFDVAAVLRRLLYHQPSRPPLLR